MKKILMIFSVGLFITSCGGSETKKEEVSEEMKATTEAVEVATEELESSGEELENKIQSTAEEVDSLLNDI